MIPLSPVERSGLLAAWASRGFTIVEMLVSVAISVIMVVLLASVVSQAMLTARKSSNELQALNAASAAMDLIATDIDSLAVTRRPFEYLQALPEPAAINGIKPIRLMLLASSAEEAAVSSTSSGVSSYPNSGLTSAICYQILYQDPLSATAGSTKVFGLYRTVLSSTTTFNNVPALLGGTNEYAAYWQGNPPANNPPNVLVDFVAENVVDLEVGIYASPMASGTNAPGAPVLLNAPSSAGSAYQQIQLTGTGSMVNGGAGSLPALVSPYTFYGPASYAEVSITVLEDAGAKLWGTGAGSGATSPANLKLKYGHTLTRRILLSSPQ